MKKSLMFLTLALVFLSLINNTAGHGGETHTTDTGEDEGATLGLTLSLEQIYVITVLMAIALAFVLENRGIIKDRGLVYKIIGFGLFFLTVDFVIYREYFA